MLDRSSNDGWVNKPHEIGNASRKGCKRTDRCRMESRYRGKTQRELESHRTTAQEVTQSRAFNPAA